MRKEKKTEKGRRRVRQKLFIEGGGGDGMCKCRRKFRYERKSVNLQIKDFLKEVT